eukprot:jgi/Galph1/2837/GphlegSOOS_G1547.1
MFSNLYEDLPAPKSSSASSSQANKSSEKFAAPVTTTEGSVGSTNNQEYGQTRKEGIAPTRWSTAAAKLLQPPPSVLVKRQMNKVSKPVSLDVSKSVELKKQGDKEEKDEQDDQVESHEGEAETKPLETDIVTGKNVSIMDEYDPRRPNDFEQCLREREHRKAEEIRTFTLGRT